MGALVSTKHDSQYFAEEDNPLVGLPPDKPLSIIPIYRTSLRSYILNKKTILKIRKTSLYSVESDILDSRGFYVFRKSGVSTYGGSLFTCAMEFRDDAGNVLASVEKDSRCSKSTAWIKAGDSNGLVVATLVYFYRGSNSKASIYTYQNPIEMEDVNNSRRKPTIEVEGNFSGHEYTYRIDQSIIAQVERNPEPTMFTLEIGPNTDIAFMTICTAVLDLLHLKSRLNPLGWCTGCQDTGEEESDLDTEHHKLTLNEDHYDS